MVIKTILWTFKGPYAWGLYINSTTDILYQIAVMLGQFKVGIGFLDCKKPFYGVNKTLIVIETSYFSQFSLIFGTTSKLDNN